MTAAAQQKHREEKDEEHGEADEREKTAGFAS
jgi:hypothetical protein